MRRTIILGSLVLSFSLISILFGCGQNGGQQQPTPGYVPNGAPAIVPTPGAVPVVPTVTPVPQPVRMKSFLTIVNQDQFAWLLEQQSRANLGYPICQKNSAFGTYACSYWAAEGFIEIASQVSSGGDFVVMISPGKEYRPIPFQMKYYPTNDNRGFALQQYGGYQYTKVVATQGNINDPTINIEVYYKDVLVARGQLARY